MIRVVLTLTLFCFCVVQPGRAETVTVFAAASLKTALDEIADDLEGEAGLRVSLSYAGSSALAWQIARGAPADLVLTASVAWMDHLEDLDRLAPGTRRDLLGNRLVLIAPAGTAAVAKTGADLGETIGAGRVAMALVDAVPAGIYGQQVLRHLELWERLSPQVIQTDNVRAALRLVAMGEVPFGVVYATDAQADAAVDVVHVFDEAGHDPILYPMAIVAGRDTPRVREVWNAFRSSNAVAVFQDHGFEVLIGAVE
jgi:molybdate transport system substrate-binding protein